MPPRLPVVFARPFALVSGGGLYPLLLAIVGVLSSGACATPPFFAAWRPRPLPLPDADAVAGIDMSVEVDVAAMPECECRLGRTPRPAEAVKGGESGALTVVSSSSSSVYCMLGRALRLRPALPLSVAVTWPLAPVVVGVRGGESFGAETSGEGLTRKARL